MSSITSNKATTRAENDSIAVVIPCYKESKHILEVIRQIGNEVNAIYVIDDACPESTGDLVIQKISDRRVHVIHHEKNKGVGGATLTGYAQALDDGHSIMVKIDGDGQMDPALILTIANPILEGRADYSKGNRFHRGDNISGMPITRIFGNICLSIMSKLSSGYWDIFDPTNGFTAIHAIALNKLKEKKISYGYFFESEMLFWLGIVRAVVEDVPMTAKYGPEQSGVILAKVIPEFLFKHLRNSIKRIYFTYFLSTPGAPTIYFILGSILFLFGVIFGCAQWYKSYYAGLEASTGTVILAALPIILGVQLLLGFLNFDLGNIPTKPLQKQSYE